MNKRRLTNKRVNHILSQLGKIPHYLDDKPVSDWDSYDNSNWNSIIRNTIFEEGERR